MTNDKYVTQLQLILSVFEDNFDPKDFSKFIKMEPTEFWYKGDHIPITGRLRLKPGEPLPTKKESCWHYSTGYIETIEFQEVSEQFAKIFNDKIQLINDYVTDKNLMVKIFIVAEIDIYNKPGFYFSRKFLNLAHSLNAEIDMDTYYVCNKCEDDED